MTNPYLNRDLIAKAGLDLLQAEHEALEDASRAKRAERRKEFRLPALEEVSAEVSRRRYEVEMKLKRRALLCGRYQELRAAYHARAWK